VRSYLDLVVPVKRLDRAKSRLVGAADGGIGDPRAHADLVVAIALDTVLAASAADGVRDVVVVTSDAMLTAVLRAEGIRCVAEAEPGLNEAYRHGASMLGPHVGALQADLPALRSAELAAAIAAGNAAYERRFGRVFLIRAAGRTRAEILGELRRRLELDDAAELAIVGEQLREIALLRLRSTFEAAA